MEGVIQGLMSALMWIAQRVGLYITTFSIHDVWSLLIGAMAATLFEIPIISRFKRH